MSKRHILLIDDDPDQRLALRLPLEADGYAVHEAGGAAEGLRAVQQIRPDLIILDVMMESTTAGFQVALDLHSPDLQSAYREFRRTPILMLTAIHTTTPLRFGPEEDYLPVERFIDKPIDPGELLEVVSEMLGD